ncbi:P pilus assembly protein, chaperone PapD [Chitinophaga sp. CF118]|uniref:fimbrial biogenesis chaperone n=1 Tax=Chitinophaga sp. CF118 TaxID=1884367 RepID=UPI0008E3FEBA|nr:molecular chaperone [Chitinophaga sp. CF118]SFD78726.1 P pilus assembly protein, chaperone PapD [Chitinophaga sp. CF118]
MKLALLRKISVGIYAVYCMIFCSVTATAQGNLLVTPRRVVFDGQKKTEELNLANTGKDTAKYVVSIMEIRMNENGTFEQITAPDSGQTFASNYLRVFPRSVILAPNEAQLVKIQLVKTSQLAPGEYRSHIYFRAVPNEKPLGEENHGKDSVAISVTLIPVFGLTIPVIIRVGESTTKVSLSDLSLSMVNDTTPRINIIFNREGNMSVYGDITTEYISPQGKVTQVGFVRGVAVYTPALKRQFHIDLNKVPGIDYHSGKLRVIYAEQANAKTKPGSPLAQAEMLLH